MPILKKYQIFFSLSSVSLASVLLTAIFSGEDTLLSKALVEWGLCGNGSAGCLIERYLEIFFLLVALAAIIQIVHDYYFKKNWFEKEKEFFFVKDWSVPNHGQSKEVGISIYNADETEEKDIFPKISIVGEVEVFEYKNGVPEKIGRFIPPSDNRIFKDGNGERVEFGKPKHISFMKIDRKNILISLSPEIGIKSFWEITNEDYEFIRMRWSFTFEVFGKKEKDKEKFKSKRFSLQIEAYQRHDDVLLEVGEIKEI